MQHHATVVAVSLPQPSYSNFQIADLVELNDLETRIGNRHCFAGDGSTHMELVFGLRAFPHANEKFSGLTPHVAADPERVTEIRVAALIERAVQSNPRLHGSQHTVPGYFLLAPSGPDEKGFSTIPLLRRHSMAARSCAVTARCYRVSCRYRARSV